MKKYSEETQSKILALRDKNWSTRKIAKELDIGKSGVIDFLKRINYEQEKITIAPTINFIDLESRPAIAAVFGRFKQNVSQDAIIAEGGGLLTYAYKTQGEDAIHGNKVSVEEAIANEDSTICAELWDIVESSDVLIGHNALNFDWPLLKARMILNGFPPMRKVKIIDTLQIVKEFKMQSNKLDSLCRALDIGKKLEHSGISLWVRCMHGDSKALDEMLAYNKVDIELLEELYNIIKPHSTRHPNLALYYPDDAVRCNVCGSKNIEESGNVVTTNLSSFTEHVCKDCRARFKSRKSITTKDQRSKYLSN